MKTQLHISAESIAECIIALIAWRTADQVRLTNPSIGASDYERACYADLDRFPDAVRTEAEICVARRAA